MSVGFEPTPSYEDHSTILTFWIQQISLIFEVKK